MDTITDLDSTKLIDMIHELELKLKNSTKSNLELKDQFNSYKEMVYNTFMSDNMKNLTTDDLNVNLNQASQNDDKGNYYFESYAGNEIHESMLKDTIRTEAYRDFMYHNKHYFKNKVVLDVGCGTGILSMFAAKSGARQVFAVDNSNIIIKAKEIIKDNGLDHIITCLQGKVEEIELPVPKVDIIISEWMGYFLLFEGMLDSVLVARDRWLKDDGILGPSCTKILLATVDDSEWYNDTVNFWKDVYGFNMTAMSGDVFRQGHVAVLKSDSISSESVVIKDIQIKESTIKSLDFTEPFKLTIKRQGKVYGFCGWFDTFFEGPTIDPIIFSTSPMTKPTHWMQTTFILQNPLEVNTNDIISGTFKCIKSNENHRELIVEISFQVNNESIQNQSFIVC
ncbi:S-adenosyl-L-methionine-dependent methyltransferase [Globomyces pollinis-pini]|nr:S-adenosyl-L-methionine-dependent methyltransferase [Globomyces pollinis-pini]